MQSHFLCIGLEEYRLSSMKSKTTNGTPGITLLPIQESSIALSTTSIPGAYFPAKESRITWFPGAISGQEAIFIDEKNFIGDNKIVKGWDSGSHLSSTTSFAMRICSSRPLITKSITIETAVKISRHSI